MNQHQQGTWPAGFGHVPGTAIDAPPQRDRQRPDRRYQNAYNFLIAHPRWVSGRLPQGMVVQALREKFKLKEHDSLALLKDAREAVELGVGS